MNSMSAVSSGTGSATSKTPTPASACRDQTRSPIGSSKTCQTCASIDDALWNQVKERQAAILMRFETKPGPNKLNHTHRKKFLLSGLLSCGICEGSYTIRGQDRYGCFNHYNRGTCDNKRTIKRQIIEARVIAGLKDKLLAPDLVAEFIKGFQEETNALNLDRELATVQDKAALAKAERSIKSILDAIEDGRYQRSMLDRLDELERQKDQIEARLAKALPPLPRIHPNIAEIYRAKIQRLEGALAHPTMRARLPKPCAPSSRRSC